jgi:hypothetical protein
MHPISAEIEDELQLVSREVNHLSRRLQRLDSGETLASGSQAEWEASTLCASATEKIYTGCERVMARIANQVDGVKVVHGENWHRVLLDRMRHPFGGRGPIVTPETYDLLNRMRSFRHRERNTYGFDLDPEIVFERAREVVQAYDALAADVRRFLDAQEDTDIK